MKLLELGNSIGGTEERLAENSRSIYGSGGGSGRKSSAARSRGGGDKFPTMSGSPLTPLQQKQQSLVSHIMKGRVGGGEGGLEEAVVRRPSGRASNHSFLRKLSSKGL